MNRSLATAWVLILLVGTGCPHAFGRGGTLDRAALKDIVANLRKHHCEPEMVMEECGLELYDRCMNECGKPEE